MVGIVDRESAATDREKLIGAIDLIDPEKG